jgi:hypothetical protein
MTDRLTLSRAFEEAGIKSAAANRLASEIVWAIERERCGCRSRRTSEMHRPKCPGAGAAADRLADRYGHLFPSLEDDHAKFTTGELQIGRPGVA